MGESKKNVGRAQAQARLLTIKALSGKLKKTKHINVMCKKIKVHKSFQNIFSGQHLFWPQMSYSTQPVDFWEDE